MRCFGEGGGGGGVRRKQEVRERGKKNEKRC